MNDPLSYWIQQADDGLWEVRTPMGFRVYAGETEALAEAVRDGENLGRIHKEWFRNLTHWVAEGFCTIEELAVLVEFRKFQELGCLDRNELTTRQRTAWLSLGATPVPQPDHLGLIDEIRRNCAKTGTSPEQVLYGLRELKRSLKPGEARYFS